MSLAGADRRLLKLAARKRKIEALLPLVGPDRGRRMREQLAEINVELQSPAAWGPAEGISDPVRAASGIDGIGGLRMQVDSPPGIGRLIRLPFYLSQIDLPALFLPFIVTDGGAGLPAVGNPTVIATIPPGTLGLSGMLFTTPVIEWAKMRIVGLLAPQTPFSPIFLFLDGISLGTNLRPFLLVKKLNVSGGANLFSQDGFIDAAVHSPLIPEYTGLRGYPLLESPNFASIQAAVSGQPGSAITFSLDLVCEILDDTDFGKHIPGPYARRDAVARRPNPEGTYAQVRA